MQLITEHQKPKISNPARIIWMAAIGIILVVVIGFLIRQSHFDLAVVQYLNHYHRGFIGSITNAVYKYFGPLFAIIGTVVITAIILGVTKNIRLVSTFAVTIAGTWLSLAVVKLVVHRLRPDPTQLPFPFDPAQIDASYPSGHAAFITALVVTIVMTVAVGYRQWVAGILGGLLVLGVGTALVIDGVHYPSDVIGSIIWAITVAPLVRWLWITVVLSRFDPKKEDPIV